MKKYAWLYEYEVFKILFLKTNTIFITSIFYSQYLT